MVMMDKKRNVKNIREVIFMYLIFAFIRKGIRKNEPSGKSEFFFLKRLEEKRNGFKIKDSLHNRNWKEGQVEMLWV